MKIEIINAPTEGTIARLCRRMRYLDSAERDRIAGRRWGAVAIVQGQMAEVFAAADRAEKAANVIVQEVIGNCPQHIVAMAVLGDTSAVKAAIDAVQNR